MISYVVATIEPIDETMIPLKMCRTLDDAVNFVRSKFNNSPYSMHYKIVSYDSRDILDVSFDGNVLTLN